MNYLKDSKEMHQKGLFIFHRDLRIYDNIGLQGALKRCNEVYCVFIFTPEQVSNKNTYRSENSIQCMIESLHDLQNDLRKHGGDLIILYGNPTIMSKYIIERLSIDSVFINKDYSPYALKRDGELFELCQKMKKGYMDYSDYYLYEPGSVMTKTKKYYKKFTPFYEEVIKRKIDSPISTNTKNLKKWSGQIEHTINLHDAMERFVGNPNPNIMIHGGRTNALERLRFSVKNQSQYDDKRDYLIYETSGLSSHIKYGCISVREVHESFEKAFGKNSGIIRELIWREFFAHVLFGYPEVLDGSYQDKYKHIAWRKSKTDITKWKKGETGFPIVDACMRQMNNTGYMHNRGRMIVANFLVKTLLIDWREGEQYFAQTLTDYDPASNNGNWQGISGTGVDMKPYFRDMNPWIQSLHYDPKAEFIKKWVPELSEVDPKDIHKWDLFYNDTKYKNIKYPGPMVNYGVQKEKMMELYRKA
jgi:deoxyribodipyrimidine photo-lyase